ncbi:MAG: HAD hydrolase-like protein, partial [Devosiaceae bacterium]|nr:HAD hydrolase-like protein [Devosiaceae bacterium]
MSAIIFDLDGTLIDSAPDLRAAANKMLAGLGHPPLSRQTIVSFIGNGVPKLVERCLKVYNHPTSKEAEDQFRSFYDENPFTLSTPYPCVLSC